MDMPDWLARRAQVAPTARALIAGSTRWSFAELDHRAWVAALRLAALGLRPGDPLALLMRNSPEYLELVHAAPRAGAVLVPLNTRLAAPELAWQIGDAGARLLVYDPACAPLAAQLGALAPGLRALGLGELAAADLGQTGAPALRERIDLDAPHTIIYTSGTTGRPKGALLTCGNHWWSAVGSALNLGHRADDRWLAPLPFFHVGGLAIILRAAIYGIAVVLPESGDPAALNRAIDSDGVTIISVVSTILQRMLDARGGRRYPAALRCVLLGGGPAPRPLLDQCAKRGLPVIQSYGLTEAASQVATLSFADAFRKLGSAGKPLLPNDLRIERDGAPAAPGEVGDILVRGPSVMRGYLNRPEETAAALRDGWLHTGDMGYLDEEGFLYVADRRSDLIISGGENVYPAEVEAALLAHPAVAEAGVVGAPDPHWGQVPVAFVRLRDGAAAGPHELIAFCQARLARYKAPREVRFASELPRNAAGKLLRGALRDLLAQKSV